MDGLNRNVDFQVDVTLFGLSGLDIFMGWIRTEFWELYV